MIKKRRTKDYKPDFDDMMSEVEGDIQEKDAEQDVINRVPELKKLSEKIDEATNTWVNATFELESAIHEYQRAEVKLGNAVNTISGKVDTINTHMDNILKEAPSKLQVSVRVANADWQKIQDMINQQHKWVLSKMQEHIREINAMFVQECRKAMSRYKEYEGCYFGHYAQWFFLFFFTIGIFVVAGCIAMLIAQHYGQ